MSADPLSPVTPIVQAENLSRFYGMILGLNNVTFQIRPGITGVVGPNGAGKTTLFRLLLGQIRPSSGRLLVLGREPWNDPELQARIAYCPESESVPAGLDPLAWLAGLGQISGLAHAAATQRARTALERVKLAPEHWRKRVIQFSKGMKQRVKLAQCLLHDPQLIVLDEPMNGLDPMGREDTGNLLRELAEGGTSIIISSHILHDLEALCADFLLLRWGRIPQAMNESAAAESPARWPEATTFRCDDPAKLARFLFGHDLLRGCDIDAAAHTLHVRWTEPARFYGAFDELLLGSGVAIHEVQATQSLLEKAAEPALHR